MALFYRQIFRFSLWVIGFLLILVSLYWLEDPYRDFTSLPNGDKVRVYLSPTDIATKKLLLKVAEPNSFIFGSSRSRQINCCYLQTRFSDSKFFHYSTHGENIFGICRKLEILDSMNFVLKNAFIFLETDGSFDVQTAKNFQDHYLFTGEEKPEYLIRHFFESFKYLSLRDRYDFFMSKADGVSVNPYDTLTNDYGHQCVRLKWKFCGPQVTEKEFSVIRKNLMGTKQLEKDTNNIRKPVIDQRGLKALKRIKEILVKHSTNYYIVLLPLYSKETTNPQDSGHLASLFGSAYYDFTGSNFITRNPDLYPDKLHFDYRVGRVLVDSVIKLQRISLLQGEDSYKKTMNSNTNMKIK